MQEKYNLLLDNRVQKDITNKIYFIRNKRVIFDSDLAKLYGVSTKVFNQSIKRNIDRFPEDFMFKLSIEENDNMNRSQIVTGSIKHRNIRFSPYVFTEHGVAMLSSVLKSKRAIEINIFIIKSFIKIREVFENNKDLVIRINSIEIKQKEQSEILSTILNIVKRLIENPIKDKKKIGFN